jgi:hypothetical protein
MNDGMAAPASVLREVPRTALPTLLGAPARRPIVMVLGMHRSGTSLCSHVLSALGLDMTDRVPGPGLDSPGEDNPLGHWERWEIVEFHDRILRFFNRTFSGQYHDFALPVAWWADPRVAAVRREITAFLERRMDNGYFGFKDPRTIRLMPMWHQIISELKLVPKIVFCLRNPAQVARSLNDRDGFSLDTGEYRWFSSTVGFFRYTKSAEICTIEYESWFNDPAPNLAKLQNFLDLPEDRTGFDLDLTVSALVHHELRHDDPRLSEASQPLIRSVYKLARRADHDTLAREQLQTIAAQFVAFQQLQSTFQHEFEQQAAAAVRLADLVRERDEMAGALERARVEVEEQDAARRQSEGRVSGLEETLGSRAAAAEVMKAELAELREALAEAERQRADHESASAGMNAEIVTLRAALVDAERRALEGEAVPQIRAELARAEQEVLERAGLIETMRTELLSSSEALAQHRREAQERLAGIVRLESELSGLREAMREGEREIAGLRETVPRAQRDAEQSAAAIKSLEGELAATQSALSAARQIGRAALNALAMDKFDTLDRPPRLGRRQAMRRWFGLARNA